MERQGANFVKETISKHAIKPSKSMGQNFLTDPNIPEKIVRLAGYDSSCGVLEIGPGLGALTSEIANTAGCVVAVELDKNLIPILEDLFESNPKINIIHGDMLKVDLAMLVKELMPGLRYHVCANLPYSITTPAISAFIEAGVFESIIIMIQKEVADRIVAKPGTSDYGAFSIYVNYHTEPELLFNVSPESFYPKPGVMSTVIKLKTYDSESPRFDKEDDLFKIVRAAFSQRRKTLANALYSKFSSKFSKEDIVEAIKKCGFDANIRGEVLSLEDFMRLTRILLARNAL